MVAANTLFAQGTKIEKNSVNKPKQEAYKRSNPVRSNPSKINNKGTRDKILRKDTSSLSKPIQTEKSVIPAKSSTPRITERTEERIKADKEQGLHSVKNNTINRK